MHYAHMLHDLFFVRRKLKSKVTYLCTAGGKPVFKVPGVLTPPCQRRAGQAEIIPVEPEQDNACAGKVADFSSSS
jgi:hypothetical protein